MITNEILGQYKTWKAGNGIVTRLPKTWCESLGISPGDKLEISTNEKGYLIIKTIEEGGNSG